MCEPGNPFTLAPGESITCNATYTVTANDGAAGTLVNIAHGSAKPPTVDPQNPPSPITHDAPLTLQTKPLPLPDTNQVEKNKPVTGSVLGNDAGSGLTVTAYDSTSEHGGRVSMQSNGRYTYTPAPDFCGVDTFNYIITDQNQHSASTYVTITVFCDPLPVTGADTSRFVLLALLLLVVGEGLRRRRRPLRWVGR